MADPTTTPLVERLRARAMRHRENATGLASAALLEEAAEALLALSDRLHLATTLDLVKKAYARGAEEARQSERERCARIADDFDQAPGDDTPMGPVMAGQVAIAQAIAAKIREGE